MAKLKTPVGPEDHTQGNPHAPVTLVEYGDYECPHCGRAYPIVKRVQKHFRQAPALCLPQFPFDAEPSSRRARR
jgi:protein-disulfide isomerase